MKQTDGRYKPEKLILKEQDKMAARNDKLIVHIGFGKTSTSQLQDTVFPYICDKYGYEFWGNENNGRYDGELTKQLTGLVSRMWLDKPLFKLKFVKPTMISNEGLSSYRDAHHMLRYAEKNAEVFGSGAHILLVIREPRSWLRSIYIQRCIHENPIQEPENFFLTDDEYSVYLPDAKFNIDRFDYLRVIEKYSELFDTVTVVKFEALSEMAFMSELFSVNSDDLKQMQLLYEKKRLNRSLSSRSVKIVTGFNKLLSLFNLSYIPKYNNKVLLERSNMPVAKGAIGSQHSISPFRTLGRILFGIFDYKIIMFKFFENIMPYQKFEINLENFKSLNLQQLKDQYDSLEDVKTYRREKK